jgi:phosphohistidine phosphatase
MDLVLWRHAEAQDGSPDLERALTPRGRKQAQRVGHWLREHLPAEFRVLASPARRTRETARALSEDVAIDERLAPGADAPDYLAVLGWTGTARGTGGAARAQSIAAGLHAVAGRDEAIVVVGHQPTIGRLSSLLLSGTSLNWSVRKGAAWWLTLRERDGVPHVVLRTVLNPDML